MKTPKHQTDLLLYREFSVLAPSAGQFFSPLQPVNKKKQKKYIYIFFLGRSVADIFSEKQMQDIKVSLVSVLYYLHA